MATVRYLVNDVDASIAFYDAIGFMLADRWGPPFGRVAYSARTRLRALVVVKSSARILPANPIELFEATS